MSAQQKGIAIPEGWALDAEGRPTTDPDAAMAGTMVPAGDAKGAGLALMVELLSAGLTGSNYAFEASSLFDDRGPSPALGHVIIAIDPGAMAGNAVARFADMAREFAAQDGVRLPGRRGQTARAEALRNGLEIEEAVIEAVRRS
jgi:(2R)-3-sulfolactate dehydrogenase (NADP+)